ncbi:carbohydrate sulfotransferase 15 isoform X2 [Protopterus annectens]|nr:carbohydrate sulfotransferase 15 isoform X2 [Protopterus annectens]XP_043911952.1 carbohydrate sulfotransferase 15 isoform X2 [Protopterus annectens]
MNFATLDVKAEHTERWNRICCFRKAKMCSFLLGMSILTFVMMSYFLTGDNKSFFLPQASFQYTELANIAELLTNRSINEELQDSEFLDNSLHALYNVSIASLTDLIHFKLKAASRQQRQLPSLKDLAAQEPHIFSVIPKEFLPYSRNPCWFEEYKESLKTDPYKRNSYPLYSKQFRTTFEYLRKAFWNHLIHENNTHYRLRCLPYFYIIGQPKCGTTDLFERLRIHPQVRFSTIKEPHWWTRKRYGIVRLKDGVHEKYPVEDYLDLFDLATYQLQTISARSSSEGEHKWKNIIIGEASASTMWDNSAWIYFYNNSVDGEPPFMVQDFIHAVQPDAKFIALLRNPVERLYSDYLYFESTNKSAEDFHEKVIDSLQQFDSCLQHYSLRACVYDTALHMSMPVRLQLGTYVIFLKDWLTVFGREQLLILRLEDHASNLKHTMHLVFEFLHLGPLTRQQEDLMTKNPAHNTRRLKDRNLGPMLPGTKEILKQFYWPFNQKLAELLSDVSFLWL